MSKQSNKNIYTLSDMECRKCKNKMMCVSHKEIKAKQLRQPFYYSQWYKCTCGWMLNLEEDKVWNDGTVVEAQKQEEEQLSFLNQI